MKPVRKAHNVDYVIVIYQILVPKPIIKLPISPIHIPIASYLPRQANLQSINIFARNGEAQINRIIDRESRTSNICIVI